MKLKLAGFQAESIVDGPGVRFVLFLQGCSHRCPGCQNPETHDPEGGREVDVVDIIAIIARSKDIDGVTISGGEPFEQVAPAAFLAQKIKEQGYNLVIYSGYTFEELQIKAGYDQNIKTLLQSGAILVDGPFVQEKADLTLSYRGSRNQRLIDLPLALREGRTVTWNPPLSRLPSPDVSATAKY